MRRLDNGASTNSFMLRRKSRPMETSFNLILQHGVILKHSLCPYWGIWSQHYHPWRYTMKLFFLPSDLTKAPITCHTIPIIVTLLAVTGLTHGVCSKNHGVQAEKQQKVPKSWKAFCTFADGHDAKKKQAVDQAGQKYWRLKYQQSKAVFLGQHPQRQHQST